MLIDNLELNVQASGSGIPFVWGHGLLGSMVLEDKGGVIDWSRVAEVSRLVRYDARGHGQSEPTFVPEDYRWPNLAKDMLGIADHMNFDTFVAGGQSMGCGTALYAALAAPERIRGLVLITPPTAWETRAAQATFYDQIAELVETQGISPLVELARQRPIQPAWRLETQPDLPAVFIDALESFNPKVLAQILRGAKLCDLPAREDLKILTIPVLILAWTDDPAHPIATAERLARLLPNSRTDAAHNMDDVATWTVKICEFISGLPG